MRIRAALVALALATALITGHHSKQLTLADISICTNCEAAVNVGDSSLGVGDNLTISVSGNFNNPRP